MNREEVKYDPEKIKGKEQKGEKCELVALFHGCLSF